MISNLMRLEVIPPGKFFNLIANRAIIFSAALLLFSSIVALPARADDKVGKDNSSGSKEAQADSEAEEKSETRDAAGFETQDAPKPEHSMLHKTLLYLPNRVFDIFDLFRARVRVGPGLGAGVRVTKVGQLYLGSSAALYAGLPGPRQDRKIPLPIGVELNTGAAVSVLEASANAGLGPDYSPSEIGAGFQLVILGLDVGFDPLEVVDLLGGIAGFDPRGDDL